MAIATSEHFLILFLSWVLISRLFYMSTPRKGKKGGGRRSPSPRASLHSPSSSEGHASADFHEASSRPRQLRVIELVDAGISCDEGRILISPSALTALAVRSGDLVRLEWSSTDKSVNSCISKGIISAVGNSDAETVAPFMSVVLTAFPSTSLASHRAAVHPSLLSCTSPPCRSGPNLSQPIFSNIIDAPLPSQHTVFSRNVSLRPLSLLVNALPASGQNLIPLTYATIITCSISTSSSLPLSGSWPSSAQWPSLLSCRLQVISAAGVSPRVLLRMLHSSHGSTAACECDHMQLHLPVHTHIYMLINICSIHSAS
jgi:hypothetical protein